MFRLYDLCAAVKGVLKFIVKSHSASVFKRASFVWSASLGERVKLYLIALCFPPRVERFFILVIFHSSAPLPHSY